MILAMARLLPIESPGTKDQVMARGNQGRASFQDDGHRQGFIGALGDSLREDGLVDPSLESARYGRKRESLKSEN
jgi:hypothetical protein